MLEIKNITKIYQSKTILDNISFRVEKGEFVSIVGPSGCGKTTLLKIIGGILKATSGSVLNNGIKVNKKIKPGEVVPQQFIAS